MRQHKLKRIVAAAALALSGTALTPSADAAGLGKLTVTSALGQPLRAEIDLTAVTREEAASLPFASITLANAPCGNCDNLLLRKS